MDSYFKAAVCDLDKLLDEFEQSTDEYDCYGTPQDPCGSKHHSLSSVLGHLQHVYPAPKLQEDANTCASSEEISLARHTGTSEVLPSSSPQNEKSVAGPDLLSTVDSGSLNEIQASNLGRCSIPVCDLVNDTGNLIHSGPAHEDTQKLQPGDFQYSESLTNFDVSCIPFPTCVSSGDCSHVSNTKQSEGNSVVQGCGYPKAEEINHLRSKSDSYMTAKISDPYNNQHTTESVKCSEIFDQLEQTSNINAASVFGTSQNCNVYSPKDGKAYEELPCVQEESACCVASKEMCGRNAIEKVDPKEESNVKSMPSDLPKRELRKCSAALSEDSIFPESMCQTEAKVELEKKITEESVDDEELDSNKILNTASTACISAEDVQTSLSDLPVSVLVVTEEKVNPLPQNEVVEVVSNTLMESHAGKSNTDPSGRESCEKTDLNEQDGYGAKIGASTVEKSADGDNYNNENATDDIDPQEALPSVFLEYEAEPYAVDIDSYYSDSMSPDTADFNIKENIITSSVAISDAELDDFLYGESLQSNVLKSSDNDSNLIEADTDEGHLTNVNNLEFTEVTEEHMQANLEEIMSISSDRKQSPTTSESESATEDTTCCTRGMTESGSGAVVPNVCREGARPKQLLGLSQVAAGQRKQNKPSVLEIENQEATCGTTEATASDNNVDVAKNSAPACSVESSSKAEGNQTSENAESFKKTAALSWKQPLWVPDSEAPNCMNCQVKFTFTRRRHHCRACGKVFCGGCCKRKCKLQYMEKEARVCTGCYNDINKAQAFERMMSSTGPDPNSSISSKNSSPTLSLDKTGIPGNGRSPSPSDLLPISVLKQPSTEGLNSKKKRRVWFADGVLPSGEMTDLRELLTEARRFSEDVSAVNPSLDKNICWKLMAYEENYNMASIEVVNPEEGNLPTDDLSGQDEMAHSCESGTLETEEYSPTPEAEETSSSFSSSSYRALCGVENCVSKEISLVPDGDKLPPLLLAMDEKGRDPIVEDHPSQEQVTLLLQEKNPNPLTFILNANLLVNVKQIIYSSELCWYFSTNGLNGLGQAEIIILLQCLPPEKVFPSELFQLFIAIYKDAMKGKFIRNMENITFTEMFLSNKEHGGFLFVSPTFQKLDDTVLPDNPFLCGILIHKLEIPWAKAFPIRLMLRLGAEYGAYPTPVVSFRNRQPLFGEIRHTIMSPLVDLRNYGLQTIDNLLVHVEMGRSCIKIPLRKYNKVMKLIDSSKQHVITIGASFNTEADSHLVYMQTENGVYHTRAISATGHPRKVTGASFVVFNGALKASSGFLAKSSIVEDGLMVQITPETMANLRQALRQKKDFRITCGPMEAGSMKEYVDICWVESEERTNKGILSPIDGRTMEGTQAEKVWQDRDLEINGKVMKCTQVYYFREDNEHSTDFPHQFAKEIAVACSTALCPHLKTLKNNGMNKIGLRICIDSDMVEYLAGSGGQFLPQNYLNELDLTLIPVIHSGMADSSSLPLRMELVFFIIEHLI